jgi:NADPH:quinone reductase
MIRAIVADAFGPPKNFAIKEIEPRAPGPGEVRATVHFAGVSFVDILVPAGKHQFKPALPFISGTEFSGQVLEVGDGVQGLAPGDFVCGGNMGGIFAEQVTLPATRMQKLPAGARMEEAAVLRASYLTSWYGLEECGHIAAGETVLVLGAAGAVGIAAIEIAKFFGAIVIASASTAEKRDFALQHGADHALDTNATDWREQVKALTNGRGLDIVVDPVGGDATERAFRALAYKGRHLVIGFAAGSIPSLPVNLALIKGASLVGVLASFVERNPALSARLRGDILQQFSAGKLRPPVGRVYPMAEYEAAMADVAEGRTVGRVLLRFC